MKLIGNDNTLGEFSFGEAFAVGVSKALGEQLLTPIVGNGTMMSGAVKLGGAYLIPNHLVKNRIGRIVGTALAVDGVEDIIRALFTGNGNAQEAQLI